MQVDGLQTEAEGSGDESADEPSKQAAQVHPLEEQLQKERQDQLEDEEKELLELPELQQVGPTTAQKNHYPPANNYAIHL